MELDVKLALQAEGNTLHVQKRIETRTDLASMVSIAFEILYCMYLIVPKK